MRYGCPSWLTSNNGTEFQGAFRHQLERFEIEHIHTSSHHPQSNGAAERVVQTLKSMLASKVAGAMHYWRSMLPTLRMEYMQRRHSTTGYSPNELVFATEVRIPPPVGELHWVARTAAVSPDVVPSGPLTQTPESYLRTPHSVPKGSTIKCTIALCKLSAEILNARLPVVLP